MELVKCDECNRLLDDATWVNNFGLCNDCWKKFLDKDPATLPLPFSE